MSRKVLTFFGLLCCFISFWGHSDDIELGDPRVGGSGCPSGTTSVTLSPDAQELSILFDEYISEAGGETGKSCRYVLIEGQFVRGKLNGYKNCLCL